VPDILEVGETYKGVVVESLRHDPRSFNKSAKNIDVDKHNQSVKITKMREKKSRFVVWN
jgi:hypothetical protein